MERRNFEDAIKGAFQGAEKTPTDSVWTNIELELERAETGKIKRRLLFYQILAAASVSFAVLMTGVGYYAMTSNNTQSVVANNANPVPQENSTAKTEVQQTDVNDISGKQPSENQEQANGSNPPSATIEDNAANYAGASRPGKPSIQSTLQDSQQYIRTNGRTAEVLIVHDGNGIVRKDAATTAEGSDFLTQRQLPALYTQKPVSITLTAEESTADPVALMMLQLADREREMREQEEEAPGKINSESLWTSVGFSAGGYNAGHASISQNSAASTSANFANAIAFNNNVSNQTAASGVSYSFGMVVGKRLGGRWVLQSGLNYMNNSFDYTSNQVVRSEDFKNFKAATLTDLRSSGRVENNVLQTAEHEVNSSLEYLSIPVQAGFIAVDHKIGVQFNAGVATDLFIQNTINPEGSAIETIQIERGSQSLYRSTNFSGLLNTELSYRFASRYRLSLNPGLRYPFNSIFKEEAGISSTPLIFDVGVRFRYIFN